MKTFSLFLWSAAIAVALSSSLHSQAPQPRTPQETLLQMKEKNAALLEKQTATLLKLDELAKEAQQIKFLGKRS
jgi:hypothetical protein